MPQPSRTTSLVERTPFFRAAGPSAMADLLRPSFTQILPRGAVLFEEGDEPDFLHIVLEGRVGLQATVPGGGRTMVELFGPGELCLVAAVVLRLPYLATAVALTEIRVLMIPGEVYRETMQRSRELCQATTELLARHWRLMVDQVVDLKLRSAEARLARFIGRRLGDEADSGPVDLREPRTAIAARLGMTPETLSRAFSELERKGLVRREADGSTLVVDRGGLSDLTAGT